MLHVASCTFHVARSLSSCCSTRARIFVCWTRTCVPLALANSPAYPLCVTPCGVPHLRCDSSSSVLGPTHICLGLTRSTHICAGTVSHPPSIELRGRSLPITIAEPCRHRLLLSAHLAARRGPNHGCGAYATYDLQRAACIAHSPCRGGARSITACSSWRARAAHSLSVWSVRS